MWVAYFSGLKIIYKSIGLLLYIVLWASYERRCTYHMCFSHVSKMTTLTYQEASNVVTTNAPNPQHHLNIRKYTIFISILINLHKRVFSVTLLIKGYVSIPLCVA